MKIVDEGERQKSTKKNKQRQKEQGGREAIEKGGEPNGFVVHLS